MENNNKLINPAFDSHGYIQVYTGNGKGKTTASLGLAMRALGRNWNILIIMFTKGGNDYGELYSFSKLSKIIENKLQIIQAGTDKVIYKNNLTDDDITLIKEGWEKAKEAINSKKYQLIILDEINIAIDLNLINLKEVVQVLKNKPQELEVVLTGRNAKPEIIEIANLVSEINPIKHYWNIGVTARKGIEL